MTREEAIQHYKYGIKCDIFSEPVITYAKIAIEAIEKQIPKKPVKMGSGVYDYPFDYECPNCRKNVDDFEHHCECGQALLWVGNNK